jgi:Mg2+ and Co2+ transporter CorA
MDNQETTVPVKARRDSQGVFNSFSLLSPRQGISYLTENSPLLRGEDPDDEQEFSTLDPPKFGRRRRNDVAGAFLSEDEALLDSLETTPKQHFSISQVASPVRLEQRTVFPPNPNIGGDVEIDIDPPNDEDEEGYSSDDNIAYTRSSSKMQRPILRFKKKRKSPSLQPIIVDLPSPQREFMDPVDQIGEPEVHDFHAPGAEQGADAEFDQPYLQHFVENVEITVCDYASGPDHFSIQPVPQDDLNNFLELDRPSWTKCRWINVQGGLSWDVIKVLALHYEIHPLAVEDLFHNSRIKADVYDKHLFISSVLLAIAPTSDAPRKSTTRSMDERHPLLSPAYKSTKQQAFRGDHFFEGFNAGVSRTNILNRNSSTAFLDARAASRNCEVTIEQVSMFLLRDRTVITFFQGKGGDIVTAPLYARLKQHLTLLRTSNDPSFLINSLLDAMVDFMTPVVSFYDSEICRIEVNVLETPKTLYTKQLHLIQAELNLLKRTVNQTQLLLQALAWRQGPLHEPGSHLNFISRTTRVYMNDVLDNCSTLVDMIDSLDRVSDDLINLIFNTVQFDVNVSMQQLSFLNSIFLPLNFLCGLYGTNFVTHYPSLTWEYGWIWFVCMCVLIASLSVGFMVQRGVLRSPDRK